MYHAGLITQLWTAALMRNSYEWIALFSGDCRNGRVSTPLISVLTGGHSSMSAPRPGSFVRRSWFCWMAHPDRLGQLHGSGDVDCQMLIREHTSSISMTAPSDAGTWFTSVIMWKRLSVCYQQPQGHTCRNSICRNSVRLPELVAWHSGRTLVSDRRTFPVLRSTCSWRVITYVGKPSAVGQPTRPTQPFILSG